MTSCKHLQLTTDDLKIDDIIAYCLPLNIRVCFDAEWPCVVEGT